MTSPTADPVLIVARTLARRATVGEDCVPTADELDAAAEIVRELQEVPGLLQPTSVTTTASHVFTAPVSDY